MVDEVICKAFMMFLRKKWGDMLRSSIRQGMQRARRWNVPLAGSAWPSLAQVDPDAWRARGPACPGRTSSAARLVTRQRTRGSWAIRTRRPKIIRRSVTSITCDTDSIDTGSTATTATSKTAACSGLSARQTASLTTIGAIWRCLGAWPRRHSTLFTGGRVEGTSTAQTHWFPSSDENSHLIASCWLSRPLLRRRKFTYLGRSSGHTFVHDDIFGRRRFDP
jgi:hypothetical protein